MRVHYRYRGIFYMLLASLGFATMAGAAKSLKNDFNAGQLVFFRNLVGVIILLVSFSLRRPVNKGKNLPLLIFRGIVSTISLYTLLFCVLHIPLGTAMTYNLTSALFIAVFSFFLFGEYHGRIVVFAVLLGFLGMVLVYKPAIHFPWYYHAAGLLSGITSAIAYISVGQLNKYYDTRIIIFSFFFSGATIPTIFILSKLIFHLHADDVLFVSWQLPVGIQWLKIGLLSFAALFGQYFVTLAYGADKAGIVSAVSYANIIFSVFIGVALGDAFPDIVSWTGMFCIISGGIIISFVKWRSPAVE